ncbi:velvet factor-domain-containing protein [Lipomyces japonicus]|uniref:velvet factor-domain-containing protein n=1 Tax=Lipomyces japonicus TaxID=56871 RepID=UPI0034CF54D0
MVNCLMTTITSNRITQSTTAIIKQEDDLVASLSANSDGPLDFSKFLVKFSIVQQPNRARSCGNADRDRRCLDPPPVLKLEIRSRADDKMAITYMKRYLWVAQCRLYVAGNRGRPASCPAGTAGGRQLVRGNMVSSAQFIDLGIDGHHGQACYFCFPDLSFSTAGYYQLKFHWVWIDPANPSNYAGRSDIPQQNQEIESIACQTSNVFRVYSAKEFPSMLPMTSISLALKQQGLWIRGGIQRNRRASSRRAELPADEDTHS